MKGQTVYGVNVLVKADSWREASRFNFLGKKFDTLEAAEAFLRNVNDAKRIYPAAVRPRIIGKFINEIQNYLTPECAVIEREVQA